MWRADGSPVSGAEDGDGKQTSLWALDRPPHLLAHGARVLVVLPPAVLGEGHEDGGGPGEGEGVRPVGVVAEGGDDAALEPDLVGMEMGGNGGGECLGRESVCGVERKVEAAGTAQGRG